MSKEQLNSINVEIAGRHYPVFATEAETAGLMQLADTLNTEIADLHKRYANKLSKTDILAMLLLTYAKKNQDAKEAFASNQLAEKLAALDKLLEEPASI